MNQGPDNYGGKVMDLAVHPTNPQIVYAAYVTGGVWKTIDGGNNWRQLTAIDRHNYTSAVTVWSGNPDHVYVGLGNPGRTMFPDRGLLRSTDGGGTWRAIGPRDAEGVYRIEVSPQNADHILVATGSEVFRTLDGGVSWRVVLEYEGANWWDDLPDMVQTANAVFVSQKYLGIARSTDFGTTWTDATSGIGPGRAIVIANAPSDPNRIYAAREIDPWPRIDIYRSDDEGRSWQPAAIVREFHQGRYDMSISVDPANRDRVILANVFMGISNDAGVSFRGVDAPPHVDHLETVFSPSHPNIVYNGNDGGVWRSDDGGRRWRRADVGVRTNLAFGFDLDTLTGRIYLSSGDYGGKVFTGRVDRWENFNGDEWAFYHVEPGNSDVIYTRGPGPLAVTLNGGATWRDVEPAREEPRGYDRPVKADPQRPEIVYAGTNKLYRSTNRGQSWQAISEAFPGAWIGFDIAPTDSNTIYVTADDIWRTRNGGTSWTKLPFSQAYMRSIVVSPSDPDVFYVGAVWDTYRYSEGGESRVRIDPGLPAHPVNRLILDPQVPGRVIAGLESEGVWISDNEGQSWEPLGFGLPNVGIGDLKLRGRSVYAAGANLWRYDFAGTPVYSCDRPEALCLHGGRYLVSATWENQYAGTSGSATSLGISQTAGLFHFTSPSNVELMVKIIDFGSTVKVFYGQLTDLRFTLRVEDRQTGQVRVYRNTEGECGAVMDLPRTSSTAPTASPKRSCSATGGAVCLGERFRVSVDWRNQYDGSSGAATGSPLDGGITATFAYRDPANVELLTKALEFDDRVLFLWGALSDLEYAINVTDTVTGATKRYENPPGQYCGGLDPDF